MCSSYLNIPLENLESGKKQSLFVSYLVTIIHRQTGQIVKVSLWRFAIHRPKYTFDLHKYKCNSFKRKSYLGSISLLHENGLLTICSVSTLLDTKVKITINLTMRTHLFSQWPRFLKKYLNSQMTQTTMFHFWIVGLSSM